MCDGRLPNSASGPAAMCPGPSSRRPAVASRAAAATRQPAAGCVSVAVVAGPAEGVAPAAETVEPAAVVAVAVAVEPAVVAEALGPAPAAVAVDQSVRAALGAGLDVRGPAVVLSDPADAAAARPEVQPAPADPAAFQACPVFRPSGRAARTQEP